MKRVDLHLHSHHSDGTWSPEELVAFASDIGLDTIALTDHDTTDGLKEARECARGKNIEFINGIELSANSSEREGLHILGYFIDPENSELQRVCRHNKRERIRFAENLIRAINLEGVKLSMDDILEFAGNNGVIGVSHLTKAIIKASGDGDIVEIYNKYFGKDSKFGRRRDWVSLDVAISAITGAGGIAVIAHPGLRETTRQELLGYKKLGVTGVEVFHHYHSKEEVIELLSIAESLDLVVTGGSDCHGPYEGSAPSAGSENIVESMLVGFDRFILSTKA